nr:hypothetical protein [Acidovorax sp. BoFeN1]
MNAEVIAKNIGVVKEDDAARRQLREPSFKIMAYCFIGVQAIDMQQINAAIGKLRQSLIKGHAQQG